MPISPGLPQAFDPAATTELAALARRELHLWLAFPNELNDAVLLGRYAQLLNADERRRWQRFRFAQHRHQYLVTRALIRSVLSFYGDLAPQVWRFTANRYGRPELDEQQNPARLRFNLSHTAGLIICGLTLHDDIGVDVENIERDGDYLKLGERFFSTTEAADLRCTAAAQQQRRFFDYWTLKEAYIKARGMGLALPLGQFSFALHTDAPVTVSFDPRLNDQPQQWRFWQLALTDQHLAAVALRVSGERADQRLRIRRFTPLVGVSKFHALGIY